jgi:hypothetical protein
VNIFSFYLDFSFASLKFWSSSKQKK